MLDLLEVRAQFPNLVGITPFQSGGQKEVCRAKYQNREVVLKLILPLPGADERSQRELEALRQIASAYVPEVIESGERILGGQKRLYIIEEFVDGDTYRAVLQQRPIQGLQFVLGLTKVLLGAAADFECIHLVHRDFKRRTLSSIGAGKSGFWTLV